VCHHRISSGSNAGSNAYVQQTGYYLVNVIARKAHTDHAQESAAFLNVVLLYVMTSNKLDKASNTLA